jgi:rRNA processing protein Gar1
LSRPYSTLKPEARLEEQERRYREQMGAKKTERQKQLAEAERGRKPKPRGAS